MNIIIKDEFCQRNAKTFFLKKYLQLTNHFTVDVLMIFNSLNFKF